MRSRADAATGSPSPSTGLPHAVRQAAFRRIARRHVQAWRQRPDRLAALSRGLDVQAHTNAHTDACAAVVTRTRMHMFAQVWVNRRLSSNTHSFSLCTMSPE
eukprot:CAMPEP_0174331604 /NCGR_PEP_ID=MMETSP0810-20121108/17620_1 /TAXON_ID=73025 ORGANISM="Eutreptiella gymnastica-like, Strain CCMP1594" /NCGR_SAMPLE_ID=MMETSP0810 /ASSEMBLY_ACC=CAM_ASM_000659 /LENGTH=101 /DNA_ID=CAMNT_0015447491 /DNA_START=720 /DNA_END=1025 /DNA_ORIENTATION=+